MAYMDYPGRYNSCSLHIDRSANSYLVCTCGNRWYLMSADNVLRSSSHGMFLVDARQDSYSYSYTISIKCTCGGTGNMRVGKDELMGYGQYSASSSYSTLTAPQYMTVDAGMMGTTAAGTYLTSSSGTATWTSPKDEKKERGEKALQHYINKARLKATA